MLYPIREKDSMSYLYLKKELNVVSSVQFIFKERTQCCIPIRERTQCRISLKKGLNVVSSICVGERSQCRISTFYNTVV